MKNQSETKIRVPIENLLSSYKSRSLICTQYRNTAIWLDSKSIKKDGDFIEFIIEHEQVYSFSLLSQVLNGDGKTKITTKDTGLNLLALFENSKAAKVAKLPKSV